MRLPSATTKLTQFTLGEGDRLVEGPTIRFASFGVEYTWLSPGAVTFIADWASTVGADGHIYYACATGSAIRHHLGADRATEPCLLRVKPEERRFDPDFYLSLSNVVGSRIAGGLVRGPGDIVCVKAVDETLIDLDDVEVPGDVFPRPVWRWYAVDLGTGESSPSRASRLAPEASTRSRSTEPSSASSRPRTSRPLSSSR